MSTSLRESSLPSEMCQHREHQHIDTHLARGIKYIHNVLMTQWQLNYDSAAVSSDDKPPHFLHQDLF